VDPLAAQVLIGLQRLRDKRLLTNADRSALSEAYTFLRTVEHRLQMAHGAQTHRVPIDREERTKLARRCDNDPALGDPAQRLMHDLERTRGGSARSPIACFALGDRTPEDAPPPALLAARTHGRR
jgi:glutamine synthetase adenylyltransferase